MFIVHCRTKFILKRLECRFARVRSAADCVHCSFLCHHTAELSCSSEILPLIHETHYVPTIHLGIFLELRILWHRQPPCLKQILSLKSCPIHSEKYPLQTAESSDLCINSCENLSFRPIVHHRSQMQLWEQFLYPEWPSMTLKTL